METRKSFVLLGPAYPWRGGIAHHTNNLANALINAGENVTLITFSKQYPAFLYPGKEQKEPKGTINPLKIETYKVLNPVNPFTWRTTAHAIIAQKPSHFIIKYWHPFFVPCFTFLLLVCQKKKIKIICIVDNLLPHERYLGDFLLIRIFFSQIDKVITQSDLVHDQFVHFFSEIPEKMVPIPVYNQFGSPVNKNLSREYLKLPKNKIILLFFGFIRPYKGLDVLLRALFIISESIPNINLCIVGECFGDFTPYQMIIDKLHLNNIIQAHLVYIPNEEIPYWLGACDLLAMPYRSVTNSAVNALGLSYAKELLFTVGDSYEVFAQKIINVLSKPGNNKSNFISWEKYVSLLKNII